MSQASALIDALKGALRRRGLTYADVGRRLGLSESSVKRVFAQKRMSLDRLEQLCGVMDLDIADLIELGHEAERRLAELTEDQERELVSDSKVLLVAVLALDHWSPARILQTYRLSEAELVRTLARLDRMRIIDLMPANRIKVRLARNFRWRKGGPIQRYFEQRLQQDFFESSFLGTDELRLIVTGSLSRRSIELVQGHMRRIAEEFDSLVKDDRRLEQEGRGGVSLVLALRPWEPALFAALRRDGAAASTTRAAGSAVRLPSAAKRVRGRG
jgi:transcriptional regulator with XRE-family HTH domain